MSARRFATLAIVCALGCAKGGNADPGGGEQVPSVPVNSIPGHESIPQDKSVKEGPRLLPAETYMRSYLTVFGGLLPLDAQAILRGKDGALFDTWRDYLAAMGMPDYKNEIGRNEQTNALMVAMFERVGIALCDRAVERDLKATPAVAVDKRAVFAFDLTPKEPTAAEFATRFDVLHRTFLGYPADLAETARTGRFFKIYQDTVARHGAKDAPKAFTPAEAGWATVCYGLVRHPEFHVY